jgi:hypothetical protein
VVELVHEGRHALDSVKTGQAGGEVDAFLTELEFVEAARARGVELPRTLGRLTHEEAVRMGPERFEARLRSRHPDLFTAKSGTSLLRHQRVLTRIRNTARSAGRGALGMGFFAGGFLLKETLQGLANREPQRIKAALKEMATPGFIGGFALFGGLQVLAERGTQVIGMKGALKSVTRFALPIYAGVAIMHAISGRSTPMDAAADATSFAASALALDASLWTLNRADFRRIPRLKLFPS